MPQKTIVVMPAYNAARTLKATVGDIPPGCVDEIIVVDDGSTDDTADVARSLPVTLIQHALNRGYGGNQKTCYDEALKRGADYVIMVHPDYQYDSRLIPHFLGFLQLGICDVLLGNRIRTRHEALASGMPVYKYLANRMLTIVENVATGQNLGEWHSGYRAYRRAVLETIPYHRNSEGFVFDSQFLFQAVHFGFKLGDVPVPARYMAEASSINFVRSVQYGLGTLAVTGRWLLHRLGLKSSLFLPAA
jgi:glycosyltransferase involved in cell wall biosynthesis